MHFLAVAALFVASALAVPARDPPAPLCAPGLYSNAQCCKVDVLGVADLDCITPPVKPTDCNDFSAVCNKIGRTAQCCAIPVLGQAVLCTKPVGAM